MERHFCVTIYIINPKNNKFVFIKHKKIGKWLPPGGHIELNESPFSAAIRETVEETGLKISIIDPNPMNPIPKKMLTKSFGVQINPIKENHEHFDLIFFAKIHGGILSLNKIETEDIKEFDLNEIIKDEFNTFSTSKKWCKYFYKYWFEIKNEYKK